MVGAEAMRAPWSLWAIALVGVTLGLALGSVLGRGLVRLVTRTINDLYFTLAVTSVALPAEAFGWALGAGIAVSE